MFKAGPSSDLRASFLCTCEARARPFPAQTFSLGCQKKPKSEMSRNQRTFRKLLRLQNLDVTGFLAQGDATSMIAVAARASMIAKMWVPYS